GGADPCRMAMAAWNWNAVANRKFIAANPAVKKLVEQMSFPLADWSTWEQTISEKGGSDSNIKKLAQEWIKTHQEQFNSWVDRAKIAS
ncbi:MAG: proline/glycine betaine ABC transporter substrate-binding protein ProX, partial [Mesorhizobium sp.]